MKYVLIITYMVFGGSTSGSTYTEAIPMATLAACRNAGQYQLAHPVSYDNVVRSRAIAFSCHPTGL